MSRKIIKRRPRRARHRRRQVIGAPPGMINIDPNAPQPIVHVMAFSKDRLIEQRVDDLNILPKLLEQWPIVWVNVDGLGNAEVIARIGEIFDLHRLALEDVVNVQRAKVELYHNHLFIVARMIQPGEQLETDQLSLFLGKSFLITFQEMTGDSFEPVRERLRQGKGRIRSGGADYLAYTLLDAVVDAYFPCIEALGDRLELLEDTLIAEPTTEAISTIHDLRRELLTLRRAIWPLREAVSTCLRESYLFISEETRLYLRDCYDHTIQVIDLLEAYREVGSSLLEIYLTSISNRTNEVMKVLTIIATIFIPLTFIVGVYGMNFNTQQSPWNMPELNWVYGYPACLGVMVAIVAVLLLFFRNKGWIGSHRQGHAPGSRHR